MKSLITWLILLLLQVSFNKIFAQYEALQPQGIYTSNFTIDDRPRSITYYMPAGYRNTDTATYGLLIFLHDDKSSAKNTIKNYGDIIQQKADAEKCIVMYPEAFKGHWNSKTINNKDTVNDVAFISIMTDFFIQQYRCNPSRIYISGIGNGGNMGYRSNCEMHYTINALATINTNTALNNLQNCRDKPSISTANFSGETDAKTAINKALAFLFTKTKTKQ